jgi:hypothetical protein
VRSPLSWETPAPVNATQREAPRSREMNSGGKTIGSLHNVPR